MITSPEAVERALRQLIKEVGRERATAMRSSLSVITNDALELMAVRVKEGDGYEGLQQDFDITPVAGRFNLETAPGLLFDINKSRIRVASTNATIQLIDSMETLEYAGLPVDRIYAAQDGTELVFRGLDGLTTNFVTPVKVKTNYIPSFDPADDLPIPDKQRGLLVSTMVEMALKVESVPIVVGEAKELAEVGRA